MPGSNFHFDRFVLRPATRELLADGQPQAIGARAFDLLLALVERGGEVVTRDELFERAWPGRVVVDDNLKVQMMALRKLLGADAIVTVPRRGYRFALALRSDVAQHREPASVHDLFGRDADLARIRAAWQEGARLLTLVGPGGVGKTRLALAALRDAPPALRETQAVAELAPIDDPAALPALVAKAFELPSASRAPTIESVARALAPLQALLLLDNCEHLIDDAARLAAALHAAAPRLHLLATSQQPLGIAGEAVLRIDGLAVDADDAAALSPAEALLVARAQAADARFVLDESQRADLRDICRHLDGLPLALELAAARVPLLGLSGVRERLDQQLQVLTRGAADAPQRHRTLRAALEWSHALLDDAQRRAFRRLAVFADSFSADRARVVIGLPDDADESTLLDLLDALVGKSLLQAVDVRGQRRLRLLFAARAFALERLADAGETQATHERHARAVAEVFEAAHRSILTLPMLHWIDRLWPELADLRTALRWATGPHGSATWLLHLVGAAGPFWAAASLDAEGAPWIARAHALLDPGAGDAIAARVWQALALRSVEPTAPIGEAVEAAERAAELFLAQDNPLDAYRMLGVVAQHGRRVQPPRDALAVLERMKTLEQPHWTWRHKQLRLRLEAMSKARARDYAAYGEQGRIDALRFTEDGDEYRAWGAWHNVALAEIALSRPARAVEVLTPVVQRLRELGLERALWTRSAVLLVAHIDCGAGTELAPMVRRVLTLLRVANAPAWTADSLAIWAAQCGELALAAQLLGWADGAYERSGEPRHHHAQLAEAKARSLLAARLAPQRLQTLRAEGRALSDEQALFRISEIGAQSPP